jgi:uncharacterized phage protein (predicted DNA packaging)
MSSLTPLELQNIKNYIRIDDDFDDEELLESLEAALIYILNATGRVLLIDSMNALEKKAVKMLLYHWHENRAPLGEATEQMKFSLESIFYQLKYCR